MGVVESWVGQPLSKCNTADCLLDRWEAGNGLIGILAEWKQVAQMCIQTRSTWFNCALRDDEAVCWVSIGHYEALAVGN